ncbi:complex I subunit 5 family protein [Desulfonatronovibrio magnus]|uniref:complex I subunit 5 family protein n=1 Tax=Desulfonatronovibrio magnus TaxID=698827 RepID=UPI0005EBC125|nr:proton-conducting transporter membrane subunit [Desulfonatronovibrio magnus]
MPELLILIPFCAAVVCFFISGKIQAWTGLTAALLIVTAALKLSRDIYTSGIQRLNLGGWDAPLSIGLKIDGLSIIFILLTAAVGLMVSLYSVWYFSKEDEAKQATYFWPLWFLLWGALNSLYFVADIFNAYVVLELISISSAALSALTGTTASLKAALRYFLVAMAGSMSFLLGVGFVYAHTGALDMQTIAQAADHGPLMFSALGLMTVGLIMKAALFPFHFWLPPAHGQAPAPVSAILSALVTKGSFFLILRLWFSTFPMDASMHYPALFMGTAGVMAVLWGSYQAVIQTRIKHIIAYSSIGQLGYLFIIFPLMFINSDPYWQLEAWTACIFQVVSHGLAKAALFLAAGNLILFCGTDHIKSMRNIAGSLPMTTFTLGLAGVSLMGLPPSGGFVAKWMLLQSIIISGQWWLIIAPVMGGLLTAAYIFKILSSTFVSDRNVLKKNNISFFMEKSALILALLAMLMGFRAEEVIFLLQERMSFELSGGYLP